jgi:hypothetical protein
LRCDGVEVATKGWRVRPCRLLPIAAFDGRGMNSQAARRLLPPAAAAVPLLEEKRDPRRNAKPTLTSANSRPNASTRNVSCRMPPRKGKGIQTTGRMANPPKPKPPKGMPKPPKPKGEGAITVVWWCTTVVDGAVVAAARLHAAWEGGGGAEIA